MRMHDPLQAQKSVEKCRKLFIFTNLFDNPFASLFTYLLASLLRDSGEESGRLQKERLHVSCLMSLCAWVFPSSSRICKCL